MIAARNLNPTEIALFFGAGVSASPPASLPIGDKVLQAIWSGLWGKLNVTQVPPTPDPWPQFEIVLDCLVAEKTRALHTLLQVFHAEKCNRNHQLIAELGKAGCWLVTTNFDEQVEGLLKPGIRVFNVVRKFSKFERNERRVPLLKLHGTVSDERGGSIIATAADLLSRGSIRSPSLLSARRKAALRYFLSGRTCFFLGYSGSDKLDILPALRLLKSRRLIQIQHQTGGSVHAGKIRELFHSPVRSHFAEETHWYNDHALCDTTQFLEELSRLCGLHLPPTLPYEADAGEKPSRDGVLDACNSLTPEIAGRALRKILQHSANHRVDLALLKEFPPKERVRESLARAERTAARYMAQLRAGKQVQVLTASPVLSIKATMRGKPSPDSDVRLQALTPRMRADVCQAVGESLLKSLQNESPEKRNRRRKVDVRTACSANMLRKAWCLYDFLRDEKGMKKAVEALGRLRKIGRRRGAGRR